MSRGAEPQQIFAIASREELWISGRQVESRLELGTSLSRGLRIEARDDFDDELATSAEAEIRQLRGALPALGAAQVRLVARVRRVSGVMVVSGGLTITVGGLSIVTSKEHAAGDLGKLGALAATGGEADAPSLPIAWLGGSAAVLLHEAVGHAAEQEAEPIDWPGWLTVRDEPPGAPDDCGNRSRPADLLLEPPYSMRRQSFRDVPLRRMSRLVARQYGAPTLLPGERIDVHLVSGGSYDLLTDEVTVNVRVADWVSGNEVRRVCPFAFTRSRRDVAASLCSASGEPLRYPGVVCSREGQQLVVGSYAPVMVTS